MSNFFQLILLACISVCIAAKSETINDQIVDPSISITATNNEYNNGYTKERVRCPLPQNTRINHQIFCALLIFGPLLFILSSVRMSKKESIWIIVCGFISLSHPVNAYTFDSCLQNGHAANAWYDGNSFDAINNVWADKTANSQTGIVTQGTLNYFIGNDSEDSLYINGQPSVYGSTNEQITFGDVTNLFIRANHTVFNLCKYQKDAANKDRIIQTLTQQSAFGFYVGKSGVAYEEGWITEFTNKYDDRWVLSAQSNDLYRANGMDWTVYSGAVLDLGLLQINDGYYPTKRSDFGCAEVLVFNDQKLDVAEIECIEDYFDNKYDLKIDATPSPSCDDLSVFESCVPGGTVSAWYDGNSFDALNNIWMDKTCNGQDATITNGVLNYFVGNDSGNSLYINGQPSVYGDVNAHITFGDASGDINLFIRANHTVFNLCKYQKDAGTNKGRIIQTLTGSSVFGFYGAKSGVANINGAWITEYSNKYDDRWVLSAQSNDLYRANGMDWTVNSAAAVDLGLLQINDGYAPAEFSDFACAEVLVFNDQKLDVAEIECIEDYFDNKYVIYPTTPPTRYPTLAPTSPPTTSDPTTSAPTTSDPTTASPTTSDPTTSDPTSPTTLDPTTTSPTTSDPTTSDPTTSDPTTSDPTTSDPTTTSPTNVDPTTASPTTSDPTTSDPTTAYPTTSDPTTTSPTTSDPTTSDPTTASPTTEPTAEPTLAPTTADPSSSPTTEPTTTTDIASETATTKNEDANIASSFSYHVYVTYLFPLLIFYFF